jgi:hypothetical protein
MEDRISCMDAALACRSDVRSTAQPLEGVSVLSDPMVREPQSTNGDNMTVRTPARAPIIAALVVAGFMALTAVAANASEVIYSNIPATLPGNFASYGNEAYSHAEFGGQIEFAGAARKNPKVTIAMSSWACQSGAWNTNDCVTGAGAKFAWPITVNVYEVGPEGSVGAKLASGSKTFKMPYRPSASPKCTGGQAGEWYGKGSCWHGKAFKISMSLKAAKLPTNAIVSVSYNTTDYGPNPIGTTACNSSSAGCFYDSLNVAVIEPEEGPPTIGADPTDAIYVNTTNSAETCESGTLGVFGPAKCAAFWEGAQPALAVSASE